MYLSSSLLRLFDATTERCEGAFRSLPIDLQSPRLEPYFVARDIPAHLIQSEQLAIGFIADQLKVPEWSFTLHPELIALLRIEDPVCRATELRRMNFNGARLLASKFSDYAAMVDTWLKKRGQIRNILDRISDTQIGTEVSHPLVTLRGSVFHVAMELFIVHANYHLGQFTQFVKCRDHADVIPFPFGSIDAEIPEIAKRYMTAT